MPRAFASSFQARSIKSRRSLGQDSSFKGSCKGRICFTASITVSSSTSSTPEISRSAQEFPTHTPYCPFSTIQADFSSEKEAIFLEGIGIRSCSPSPGSRSFVLAKPHSLRYSFSSPSWGQERYTCTTSRPAQVSPVFFTVTVTYAPPFSSGQTSSVRMEKLV